MTAAPCPEQKQNMSQGTGAPAHPENDAVLARWRVGLIAFRDAARRELPHQECHRAGVEAMRAAFPDMKHVGREMSDAIGWVTRSEFAGWFRQGVPQKEWIWPPDRRGVGHYRR